MYENMLNNYKVFFEGMPEVVFYGRLCPRGNLDTSLGMSFRDDVNYCRGLRGAADGKGSLLRQFELTYRKELNALLGNVLLDTNRMRRGVVVIPSGQRKSPNRITALVRSALAPNTRDFKDLTHSVVRTRDVRSPRMKGKLSYKAEHDSIGMQHRVNLQLFGVILVIGDILDTGTSFRAMDDWLRDAGFTGTIVNFAMARSIELDRAACSRDFADPKAEARKAHRLMVEQTAASPIEGLVFDLDQTLLDDGCREMEFEDRLSEGKADPGPGPYAPYEGVEAVAGLNIPFAIVSDRPLAQIGSITGAGALFDLLYSTKTSVRSRYFGGLALNASGVGRGRMPKNVFSFYGEPSGKGAVRSLKQGVEAVGGAVGYLRDEHLNKRRDARIVGVGSTPEDIAAYAAAGIESVLALWGVPDLLREPASLTWGADHVFDDPITFAAWVRGSAGNLDPGLVAESVGSTGTLRYRSLATPGAGQGAVAANRSASSSRGGQDDEVILSYERAIAEGDERYATVFLAELIEDDDPKRAAELYERAIAAGDEYYATYGLAELIAEDNPWRAAELYARAIAAGDELWATSGLADLISWEQPERAAELYERAIAAGDERYATFSLAELIEDDDPGRAAELYERAIAAGDEVDAAKNLAALIAQKDPERAARLYELARRAEDDLFA